MDCPRNPGRAAPLVLACAIVSLTAATAGAQATWITRVPPERVLQWQPRTVADLARAREALLGPHLDRADEASSTDRARSATTPGADYNWSEVGPPARAGHFVVLDTRRHRMILLGGLGAYDPLGAVWGRPLPSGGWSMLATLPFAASGGPWAPRKVVGAVYDSLRDRVLVLHRETGLDLEALSLSGAPAWSHLWSGPSSPTGPAAVALDTRRDELVLLGVWDAAASAHRTIRIPLADPSAWTSVLTQGPQPVASIWGSAVYDPARDAFDVLFGSRFDSTLEVDSGTDPELFSLDATTSTWTSLPLPGAGSLPRPFSMLSLDAARDRLLLKDVAGDVAALSLRDGAARWLVTGPLGARYASAMVFDPLGRRLYVDGGADRSDIWMPGIVERTLISATVDSAADWTPSPPEPGPAAWQAADLAPGARWLHSILLDPEGQQTISLALNLPRVVAHRLSQPTSWVELGVESPLRPEPRYGAAVTLDPVHHALVVYGGATLDGSGALLDDVWQLSLAPGGQWSRIALPGSGPSPRRYSSFVYDAPRSRFLLMGGDDLQAQISEVWELKLDPEPAWRQLVGLGPLAPYLQPFVDDARGDAWTFSYGLNPIAHIVFGQDTVSVETVPSEGGLPPFDLYYYAMFDPGQRRLMFFEDRTGGYSAHLGQFWSAMLGGAELTWVLQDANGPQPAGRGFFANAFDPVTNRIIIDGGQTDNGPNYADTYALQLPAGLPTATLVSLEEATSDARGVMVRWWVNAAPGTACTVDRSVDGASWTAAGEAVWLGAHEVRYDGAPLAPGARAAFRLGVAGAGGMQWSEAVWLDGPAAGATLALAPISNPSRGAPTLALELADGPPARLRLLDVSGRLVSEATLPAGTRRWTAASPPPPGLYFAELVQRGERRVARVVVTR